MKSHKFLAKSIINRFSFRDKGKLLISYYDFDNNEIKCCTTKSFNTEMDFYTDENENNLKRYSEEKIGRVIKYLEDNFQRHNCSFELSNEQLNIIKSYASYQLMRDESIQNMINDFGQYVKPMPYFSSKKNQEIVKNSLMFKSLDSKTISNILIEYEKYNKTFFKTLDNMAIIIIFNYTNRNYIINSSFSSLLPYSEKYFIMNLTLTPKIRVSFCLEEQLKDVFNDDKNYLIVDNHDENSVIEYNKNVFYTSKINKPHILIGDRKELEYLKEMNIKEQKL